MNLDDGIRCSSCHELIADCLCDRAGWDDDELGVDPDAKWYDPESQGFLLGPGELPPLPRLPNA